MQYQKSEPLLSVKQNMTQIINIQKNLLELH